VPTARDLAGRLALAAVLFAAAAAPGRASAQIGHGLPAPARPLHVRLARADVVAIGEVERVELGRIAVRPLHVLRGAPADGFAVKRAPSRAPELAPGDRVLLLLAGARAPYVLVDEPREVVKLADPAREELWRAALAGLVAAGDEPGALLAAYLGWIDGADDELRQSAVRALANRRADSAVPLPPEVARERARIALDPARPAPVRRASATLACLAQEGLAALLAGLGRADVDPAVAQIALASGGLARADGMGDATVRALGHPSADVRRAGVGIAALLAGDASVRRALERVARSDPEEELRGQAREALAAAGAPAPVP
jgi:hypothetical protein